MFDVRGTINLVPMMRAVVMMAVGIVAGDAVGERLTPEVWLMATLAMALLAWWAKEKMWLGSLLVLLTIAYLGAFSMSWKIASDDIHQPYSKQTATTLQETVNEARLPMLATIRQRLSEEGMTKDAVNVMTAMTLAEKSGIDREMRDSFAAAGVSHVLALSGLHVGIIALMLGLLLGGRHRKITEIVLIVVIWSYVLIAGLPVSALRAALMLTVWSILSLFRRRQHPLNVLGTAMLFMLILNPAILFDVGFQLSCSAVFFLLLCMPFIMEHCPWSSNAGHWLWGFLSTSIVAQMATAPLVALYFARFSVYSLLANIVVVPLTPVVIVVGVMTVLSLSLPFTWLITAFVWVENHVVAMLLTAVQTIAELPGASVEDISINVIQTSLLYVLMFCFIVIVRKLTFSMNFTRNL